MDVKKAQDILENEDWPKGGQEISFAKAIEIIERSHWLEEDSYPQVSAEHDKIWFGDFESSVKRMTEAEFIQLCQAGWFEDDGYWTLLC